MSRIQLISPGTLTTIVQSIGGLEQFHHNCHACSLAIVRTKLLPQNARVARGFHSAIMSQHSWVVLGDPYDPKSIILDGTLWSYTNRPPVLYCGRSREYRPKGSGRIWDHGFPPLPTTEIIPLDAELSDNAKIFLSTVAPNGLDFNGWIRLANSPVQGWPCKEIFTAMYQNDKLRGVIPIDVIGMITDMNPGKLYW